MKICIVSLNIVPYLQNDPQAHYGGAEVQAAFLARALSTNGQKVSMVVSNLGQGMSFPHDAENAFHTADGLRGLRFFHPRLTGTLHALERAEADIYYQRNAGMITGVTAMFCRRHRKVFVYGAGSNTDFSFRTARVKGLRDKGLYYVGLKLADGFVVQNNHQKDICLQNIKRPVAVIPNGVQPSDNELPADRKLIVWVGALRRVKRPELLLELAGRMPHERFLVVGGSIGTERGFARRIELSESRVAKTW